MLKLRRLKIDRFRNVAPGTELHFDDGVNVLLGKNGTGKTTLLSLISAVLRSDFTDYSDERLAIEAEFEHSSQRSGARMLRLDLVIDPHFEENPAVPETRRWSYSIEVDGVRAEGSEFGLSVTAGEHDVAHPPATPFASALIPRVLKMFPSRSMWEQSAGFRFDESLETFTALTTGGSEHALRSCGGVVPPVVVVLVPGNLLILQPGRDFFPSSFFSGIRGDLNDDVKIVVPASWSTLLGFGSLELKLTLVESKPGRADAAPGTLGVLGERHFGKFSFKGLRRDGTFVLHDRFSYGQKRLLALLYYLEVNPYILIADELVNGLHHEWIEKVVGMLGDRQSFLTSQNPLLFDFLKIESAEQVQRMFVRCEKTEDESLVWRNMTPDEARTFHEEISAGVEYASEVLLRRGLW